MGIGLIRNRRQLVGVLLASVCWSHAAQAAQSLETGGQEAVTQPKSNEQPEANTADIIVTARKRNETALETPATISILSDAGLQTRNITSAVQLNGIVPGLVLTPGPGSQPGVTFRGLGTASATFAAESSVAMFQDGVYLSHFRDYMTPFYDLDHIEFIKGTQSTLLGKNTSVGAISIINHKPTTDFGYEIRATHSFRIDQNRLEGMVNVPLSDRVQVRAAVLASDEDGYYHNQYTGRDEMRLRDLSGRLSIAVQPTDSLDALLSYQHDDRRARGQSLEILTDPTNVVHNRATAAGQSNFNNVADFINGSASDPLGGTVRGPTPMDDQITNRLNMVLNWKLGDYTLTSQTAFLKWRARYVVDLDFTAASLFNLTDVQSNRTISQEVRLSSPNDGWLQYLAGVYYYNNHWGLDRTCSGSPSNTVGFPLTGMTNGVSDQKTTAYSVFASARAEILKNLALNVGVRYTHEHKTATFVRAGTGTFALSFPDTPLTTYPSQTTQPLDYDVGLTYTMPGGLLLYISHAKGSKSGGFQEFPTTIAGGPYKGEQAYSTEAGVKLRLGGRGSLTAAIFNTAVKGYQATYTAVVGTPPVSQNIIGNANIRSRGFEASGSYRLMPGLMVTANVTHAIARFTDRFPTSGTPVAADGEWLVRSPKWTGTVGADYEFALTPNLNAFAGATFDFASAYLQQFLTLRPDAPRSEKHQTLDLRFGVRTADERWALSLIGTNVTNEKYATFVTSVSVGGTGIGNQAFYGALSRPRVIALQVTAKY